MKDDLILNELESRIGLFIGFMRRERLHQTKDEQWSQIRFVQVSKQSHFYDVPMGEAVCSRATLIQIEKGRRIKDQQLYLFFLNKLNIELRWLELKMVSQEIERKMLYTNIFDESYHLLNFESLNQTKNILYFLYDLDEACIEFCQRVKQSDQKIDLEKWVYWIEHIVIVHPILQRVLSEIVCVELYLNQHLKDYVKRHLKYLCDNSHLYAQNLWFIRVYTHHLMINPELHFTNHESKDRVYRNLRFRLISQSNLDIIMRFKRFNQEFGFDEPYPYIQTQIQLFVLSLYQQHHFDIDHIFNLKSLMSK